MPNLQVTCMLPQAYMSLWLPFLYDAGCARQDRKGLFEKGPPVLGNFELSTTKFGTLIEFDERNSTVGTCHFVKGYMVHLLCTCTVHLDRQLYFRETLS